MATRSPSLHESPFLRPALLACVLSAALTGELQAQNCPPGSSTLISQPIDYQNGFKSDATVNDQVVAEQLVLAQATDLNSVTIIGGFGSNSVTNNFTLAVHADSAGLPGALVYIEHGMTANLVATGVVLPPPLIPIDEYEVTLTPAAQVALPAGVVWFQIYNDAGGGQPFYWLTGTLDAGSGIQGAGIAFAAPGVSFSALGLDMAMTICGASASISTPFCFGDGTDVACPCGNLGAAGEGCANSTGAGSVLSVSGSNSVSANDLVLTSTGSPPAKPGVFFQGDALENGGLGSLFGDGVRCVGGAVQRFPVVVTDGAGAASSPYSTIPANAAMAGESRYYQWWHRDPTGSPCAGEFNVSTAAAITWIP